MFCEFRATLRHLDMHPLTHIDASRWLPSRGAHVDTLFAAPAAQQQQPPPQEWSLQDCSLVAALVWRVNRALQILDAALASLCAIEHELETAAPATSAAAPSDALHARAAPILERLRCGLADGERFVEVLQQTSAFRAVYALVADSDQRVAQTRRRDTLRALVLELRRFLGSHIPLALCVQDARKRHTNTALAGVGWAGRLEGLSALDLFDPRDAMAPLARYLPDMLGMLRTVLLGVSGGSTGGASGSAGSGRKSATASAKRLATPQHNGTVLEQMRLALPFACNVREFVKNHVRALDSSPAYREFVVQVMRVMLYGGYAHAKSPLSMALVLRTEWWLRCRQPPSSDQRAPQFTAWCRQYCREHLEYFEGSFDSDGDVCAFAQGSDPERAAECHARLDAQHERDEKSALRYIRRNPYVVLAALREFSIATTRNDSALHAAMCIAIPAYAHYERGQLQAMDALRVLYNSTGELRMSASALVAELPKSGGRWSVFRRQPGDFVALLCDECKHLDEQRLADSVQRNPRAECFPTDWLPAPLIELIVVEVETLVPGAHAYRREWFERFGFFHERTLSALDALYGEYANARNQLSLGKQVHDTLSALPRLEYSFVRWFYHVLRLHNAHPLLPLPRQMALAQLSAVRRLYSLRHDEPLRPHHVSLYMCQLLGCNSIRTFVLPDCGDPHLLNSDDLKFNTDDGHLYCTARTRCKDPLDRLDRPLMSSDERTTLLHHCDELCSAREAARAQPNKPDALAAFELARKRYAATALSIARRLRRVSNQRRCDVLPASAIVTIGQVLVVREKARPNAPLVRLTHCARCGHPTRYSPAMFATNGFSCQFCDAHERRAAEMHRCAICDSVVVPPDAVRRERSRSASAAQKAGGDQSQQQQQKRTPNVSKATAAAAAPIGVELLSKLAMGTEKYSTYWAPSAPGVGPVHAIRDRLRVYDEVLQCTRHIAVCEPCWRPFMQKQQCELTLGEMRAEVERGRTLRDIFGAGNYATRRVGVE